MEMTLEQRHEWNERGSLPRWERTAFQEKRNKNCKGPENGTINPNACTTSEDTTLGVYSTCSKDAIVVQYLFGVCGTRFLKYASFPLSAVH